MRSDIESGLSSPRQNIPRPFPIFEEWQCKCDVNVKFRRRLGHYEEAHDECRANISLGLKKHRGIL